MVWAEKCFALAIILIVAFVNVMSAKWGAYLQNVCLAAKLFAIAFIVVIGLIELATGTTEHLSEKILFKIKKYLSRLIPLICAAMGNIS